MGAPDIINRWINANIYRWLAKTRTPWQLHQLHQLDAIDLRLESLLLSILPLRTILLPPEFRIPEREQDLIIIRLTTTDFKALLLLPCQPILQQEEHKF